MDITDLVPQVRERRLILFVGAGVSRTLGLPSWAELMAEMATQLGYDPDVFTQYAGFLELAEFYESQTGSLGKFSAWMDRAWHANPAKVDASKIHQAIVDLDFPIIYTTNFDRWLEIAYERRDKPVTKVANAADIAKIGADPQIVKFHGDFDDYETLVLAERAYFERLEFEAPLDIKLRSDSIGKGILFIGYSLADLNIRYLLYKLHKLWSLDPTLAKFRPRSFLFTSRPNPIQQAILAQRDITLLVSDEDHPERALLSFLELLLSKVKNP